jgi:hypothetical protein
MGNRSVRGEAGRAEIFVLGGFALVIAAAFLWALVLHEKPAPSDDAAPADPVVAAGSPGVTPTPTTPATAALPPPRTYRVVGGVNLREGPGSNTKMLSRLDDRQTVVVVCKTVGQNVTGPDGSTDLWLRLDLGEYGVGFVSALYVNVGDDLENPRRIGDCAAPATR